MKKLASLLLALVMIVSCIPAMAQTETVGTGAASITISNAALGETYAIYKLFNATVTGQVGGSIAYTGTIPDSLTAYFSQDAAGNISAKDAAKDGDEMSAALRDALTAWAEDSEALKSVEATENELKFAGLEYGYYVVTTSQGEQAITVVSTNPNPTITDKNVTEVSQPAKTVDNSDVSIGDTVTYTVKFNSANYEDGTTKIVSYKIKDTLPSFLSSVTVTSVTIDGDDYKVDDAFPQFDANKEIDIPWVDDNGNSLYKNGAEIVITYTAVVTESDNTVIEGAGNTNTVTVIPYFAPGTPSEKEYKDEETIYTYAAALKKVDENGAPLAGAQFTIKGLIAAGNDGYYTVVSYNPDSEETPTTLVTDKNGLLVIEGLNSEAELLITEVLAPSGYNKLTAPVTTTPVKTLETVTTTVTKEYYDENGNLTEQETNTYKATVTTNETLTAAALEIENKAGATLPSTGGMGTTILYVGGGILVLAALVMLIVKRRAAAE